MTNKNLWESGLKSGFIMIALMILFLMVSQSLSARGAGETDDDYTNQLQIRFEKVIEAQGEGKLNGPAAIAQLNEIREQFRYRKTEQFLLMESCIDAIESGDMTPDQAKEKNLEMIKLRQEEQIRNENRVRLSSGEGDQNRLEDRDREQVQLRDDDEKGSEKKKQGN